MKNKVSLNDLLSREVNLFQNAYDKSPKGVISIIDVLTSIKNGKYRKEISKVRDIYKREGKSDRYQEEKKKLHAVTFGGVFEPTRKKENLKRHSGLVIADLDQVGNLEEIKQKICSDSYVLACFNSPSDDGLKFLIPIPVVRNDADYKSYLQPIARHFKGRYDIDIYFDKDGKDICRLCFVSYDPELYLNENAAIFTEKEEVESGSEHLKIRKSPSRSYPEKYSTWKEQAIKNIVNIIARSQMGNRHASRLKAGYLAGGFVAGGMLTEEEILPLLRGVVAANTDLPIEEAFKDVSDSYKAGKSGPITFEMKETEYEEWLNQKEFWGNKNERSNSSSSINSWKEGKSGRRTHQSYSCTELGNSYRFVDVYGENIRYNHTTGKWHIWDGIKWAIDDTLKVESLAKNLVNNIFAEAQQKDNEMKLHLIKHAVRTQSNKNLKNTLNLVKSEQKIGILKVDLDQDPYLFNTLNGTINLKTGEVRKHRRSDLISKVAPVYYDPEAKATLWGNFLRRIFRIKDGETDFEMINFLQQASGLSLTGDIRYHYLFFAYGEGSNGKSTFFETIASLLGDYYHKAPVDLIMLNKSNTIPTDIADLAGKRCVVTSEVEDYHRLAEAKIKDLTGGDTLTGRHMRQDFFTFKPTHKLWAYGNHKPRIKNTDYGIWRRILLIPFTEVIQGNEEDKNLKEKLKLELPGILNWCTEGSLSVQENGLIIPKRVREASDNYRMEMDKVQQFIIDCCGVSPRAFTALKDMYAAYLEWASKQPDVCPLGRNTFNEELVKKGFQRKTGNGNIQFWHGIELVSK